MLLLGTHMMDSIEEKVKIEGLSERHVENCLRRWKSCARPIWLLIVDTISFRGFALLMIDIRVNIF